MWRSLIGLAICSTILATPVHALYEGLQCVPYARALSGVDIRGDAHSWWDKAAGIYDRGSRPKVGAVMVFRPHGGMRLGHVAAVRKVVDNRTVLISHANWSTIGGARGHIEENVMVVDASDSNDWSRVKVWYTPNAALGTTEWPLNGFIYPAKARSWNDGKKAVANLLGSRLPALSVQTIAAAKPASPAPSKVAYASRAAKPNGSPGFSLSQGLKSDIEKAAKAEAAARRKSPV
jgi:surface antigen